MQAFFEYATDVALDSMDNPSKAALRLSCKIAKAFVDGTVTTAAGVAYVLKALLRCDWQLSELSLRDEYPADASLSLSAFNSLLHALCSKFSTLQVLEIDVPTALFDLPANIGQLSKLGTLKITCLRFKALPASFGQLSSLERLELYTPASSSQLTISIDGLAPLKQLTQLKYLRMDGSLVSKEFFPTWLGSCHFPVLVDLTLGGGWLRSLPSSISNFRGLTALCIGDSDISEVPDNIGYLRLLKKLHLPHAFRHLPTTFSKLTALEELDVKTDMQNFALVEHFHKLTRLQFSPKMEEGVIIPYPEFLWTFMSLRNLHLSWSALPSLPDALGNMTKLEFLFLQSHQNIEELPETIGNLTCLTSFKIQYCPSLLKLPESIGNLQDLRELDVYRCHQLTTLPESIGDLQHLETLKIVFCERFDRLPSSIGNLRALKELIVDSKGLVVLPESFADLVLDKTAEECSLEKVLIGRGTQLALSGPRAFLALNRLRERGVLQ